MIDKRLKKPQICVYIKLREMGKHYYTQNSKSFSDILENNGNLKWEWGKLKMINF